MHQDVHVHDVTSAKLQACEKRKTRHTWLATSHSSSEQSKRFKPPGTEWATRTQLIGARARKQWSEWTPARKPAGREWATTTGQDRTRNFEWDVTWKTRAPVAVEPRRPPKTNVGTETAFGHDHCKPGEHIQKSKHLCGQRSVDTIKLAYISTTSIYMLSVIDFDPKGTISEVRVHAGAKFGHTGCWSIAKCSQSLCRNYTGVFRS